MARPLICVYNGPVVANIAQTLPREPTERAGRLKERFLSAPREIDIERARIYTEVFRRNEGAPPCTRAALALAETLRHMSIRIEDDELIVGVRTSCPLAGVIPVERGDFNTVMELELERLLSRERGAFHIRAEDRRELEKSILPYWRGRTARSGKVELWKKEGLYGHPTPGPASLVRLLRGAGIANLRKVARQVTGGSWSSLPHLPRMMSELAGLRPSLPLTVFDVQGHFVPGYGRVLETGFRGIARSASERLAELQQSDDGFARREHASDELARRRDFYEAAVICAEAVCEHSERYAKLASDMARGAVPERARELEGIASRCRAVPANPPSSFAEAVQSLWMSQVAITVSYGMSGVLSPGRVDQYLFPYYEADAASGRITRDGALELVEEYYLKLAGELIMLIEMGKDTASEVGVGSNTVTIGGLDREGNDAVNEVSYLLLDANDGLRALANNLSARVSRGSPPEFLARCCESYRSTSGLALFNDEMIVRELEADGFAEADARDYSIVGCVEPTSTGNTFACTAGNDISLAGVLEMALNEGRMLYTGRRVGAKTPGPAAFRSFEDVKAAYERQLRFNVARLVKAVELLDRAYADDFPSPLVSSTVAGCLESGRDVTRGGALYNYGSVTGRGLGTVADSLAAIRWAVYEEGLLDIRELMRHLRSNFRRAEALRQTLINKAPRYGNDDAAADEMAAWVSGVFADAVRSHSCGRGGFYRPGIFSYGVHVVDGLLLGATPDGRRSGEPVSNGVSPSNGRERNGPTAVMSSAARATSAPLSDGTSLNMRLSPGMLDSEERAGKLGQLVRGYFDLGGRHVQFNVVDTETLRDARDHPERHADLVVRVSGYCAYFTDLGRSIQDDIIARTTFKQ